MKKLLCLSILLLLICSTAWACGSYEECMDYADGIKTLLLCKDQINTFDTRNCVENEIDRSIAQDRALKYAIAYKLDEISRKLERANQNDKNTGIIL